MDESKVILLKNIVLEDVEGGTLIHPYAVNGDVIDGVRCNTCGLMRMPLMENDMISEPRTVVNKKGHEKQVCDVYLMDKSYMVYYRREYIVDYENRDVTPTDRGRYGGFENVYDIIEHMKLGRKVVDKARRIDAKKQEKEMIAHTLDTIKKDKIDRMNMIPKEDVEAVDFFE